MEEFIRTINQASSVLEKKTVPNASQVLDWKVADGRSTHNLDNINKNTDWKDFEILNHIADSMNPYTGEIITGIDEELKARLEEIAVKIKIWEFEV